MSEPIGMFIEIGGILPAFLLKTLIETVQNEISEITEGPISEKELRNLLAKKSVIIRWSGISDYGECSCLKNFCREHKLSYVHGSYAKYEYNAMINFWKPGMNHESQNLANNDCNIVCTVNAVRPLVMVLLEYAKNPKNLPLLITEKNETIREALEKGLKGDHEGFIETLKEKLLHFLVEPELPALIIEE